MIDPGLEGKVILITGANNPFGIGAATARAFAVQRARVFLTYLRESPEMYGVSEEEAKQAKNPSQAFGRYQNAQGADRVVGEIRARGGEVEALELDVSRQRLDSTHLFSDMAVFGRTKLMGVKSLNNTRQGILTLEATTVTIDGIDGVQGESSGNDAAGIRAGRTTHCRGYPEKPVMFVH